MILSSLFIARTDNMGRGVFTNQPIDAGEVIEVSPVIVMSHAEREKLDATTLHDYIFEWDGHNGLQCCMAMGWVPVYNHSYAANCDYDMDYDEENIIIKTVRPIQAGEQLFINYNGEWNDEKPIWFDVEV